ncbi:conserved hypothetical protein [Paecilomyces variotii No. 5]|uniref:Major facilitator superfamily (MFS) profile domain-containing protein n=1 Tax=Byssochlamys spectabilis (strain No. 5 / NBRC 109023) TaxID=1356009 RepID=V5HYF2_BYSSN|nr:conserved hypothetical protein [Paecilomyces variotii No. 5]
MEPVQSQSRPEPGEPEEISRFHEVVERRVIRKLDYILLPFLSLLFLLNSLDRSNIGNAETAHFTRDAGLDPKDLNTAVACFFAFFVALQPVGAAAGRKFGMGRWVPTVMALWGLFTMLHVWINKRWQLITVRILIGCLEAGFYPTTVSYLSLFYTRYEFARRLSLFYGQYAVAGALGGFLAFVIFYCFPPADGTDAGNLSPGGWKPWQTLFLIEGALTMLVAIVGFFWLPRSPGTAWFLNKEERTLADVRIRIDRDSLESGHHKEFPDSASSAGHDDLTHIQSASDEEERRLLSSHSTSQHTGTITDTTSDSGLSKTDILSSILFLPLIGPILIMNIASSIPGTAFSIFLPLVMESLNLSSPLYSNLLTVPPFLIAAVTLYLFSRGSDRSHQRILPILCGLGLITLGLIMTLVMSYTPEWSVPHKALAQYLSLCLLLSGSFVPSPLTVAWLSDNIPQPGKRAIILGVNGWGNLAGVLAALLFAPRWRSNEYRVPLFVTLGFVVFSFLGFVGLEFMLTRLNAARVKASKTEDLRCDRDDVEADESLMQNIPSAAVIGGSWWDVTIRHWVGERFLRLSRDEAFLRRGDEKVTFTYGL